MQELRRECAKLAGTGEVDAQQLLDLTSEIIRKEHEHQERRTNVNQEVEALIRNASSEG